MKQLLNVSNRRSMGIWAALIFLVALNLRPAIAAVGPLLTRMGDDLGWGSGLQGALASVPLLAFAAVSPLVTIVVSVLGIDVTILFALVAIAAGDIIRSFAGETGVWAGTVIFASAIAVGNVLVPVVAKRDYSNHVATATGAYSACITCGSALAGLTASAMAEAWGGWRHALAFWAVPPLLAALLWSCRIVHSWRAMAFGRTPEESFAVPGASYASGEKHDIAHDGESMASLLRRPMTWWVTLFMGAQSSAFYTMSNWMPSVSEHAGFSVTVAGVHLFIFQSIGIFSGLLIPKLMHVRGNQVCAALTSSVPMVIAGIGMMVAPVAMPVWAFIGGAGQGASLVVALALIAMRGRSASDTVRLSGLAQSAGYLIASMGPLLFGVLCQLTGGYTVSLVVMTAIAVAQCAVAMLVGRSDE